MVAGIPELPRAAAARTPRVSVCGRGSYDRDAGVAHQRQRRWSQPLGGSTARRGRRQSRPSKWAVYLPTTLRPFRTPLWGRA